MQRSPEELKEEKRTTKKSPKSTDLSLLMLVHTSQSSSLLHSCQILLFPPKKIILCGVWEYITHHPRASLQKPSSPEHDTEGQDRNQKRSHASKQLLSQHFWGQGGQKPEAEPFTPNQSQKQRSQLPKASLASMSILLPTASHSHIPPSLPALPSPAAQTQQHLGVSSED